MKTVHSAPYERLLALLVEARKDAGLTQQELVARMRRPQSYVSKYERGERRLDVIEFLRIARIIGIEPQQFLGEIEPLL